MYSANASFSSIIKKNKNTLQSPLSLTCVKGFVKFNVCKRFVNYNSVRKMTMRICLSITIGSEIVMT